MIGTNGYNVEKPSTHSPLKQLLFLSIELLIESGIVVADPGITAQALWLVAEPRFARIEVSVVAKWLLGPTQADITGGSFRD